MKGRTAITLSALLLTAACGTPNPANLPSIGPDAAVEEEEDGPVSLTVTPAQVVTPWPAIPVTGSGPANGTLVYESQGGGQDTVRLGATGEFCLDVPLLDGDNTIKFEAISEGGLYSEPKYLTISRQGVPPVIDPVDPGDIILEDRTPGTVYYGQDVPYNSDLELELENGTFAGLVDGNTSEVVKFHADGILTGEIIAYQLDELMAVHGFEVSVPDAAGETCGPDGYQIWVSDEETPDITLDGVTWHKIVERTSSDTSDTATTYEDESVVPGINARHMAIKLTDTSCAHWFTLNPRSAYGIMEIRVIAEDGEGRPTPIGGAPSCAAGGI